MRRFSLKIFLRTFILALVLLTGRKLICYGQTCHCADESLELSRYINCKPVRFKNGASLYWQYNCDSSWLTYSSKLKKRKVLFSLGLIDYVGRLGYSFHNENRCSFTILNRQISGCCAPPQYILFDKATGRKIHDFGNCILSSQDLEKKNHYNFLFYFTNKKYNQLTLYFIDSKRKLYVDLPNGRMRNTNNPEGPETLFYDGQIHGKIFTIKYSYGSAAGTAAAKTDSVQINLGNSR